MTTIAIDTRVGKIVADTQISGDTIYRTSKIRVLSDGSLFAGAGHIKSIEMTRIWMDTGIMPDYTRILEDINTYDFSCFIWNTEGVRLIGTELTPLLLRDKYMAIGSGAHYALAAMDAGAPIEQAVRIACERDSNSSAPIDVVKAKF